MAVTPDAILYFAAGLGTRMKPLTDQVPKPLIRVGNTTLIDHAIAIGDAAGVTTRVANVHHRAGDLKRHLAGRNIAISDETEELLETGGGLRKALPLLGPGPVFTMNTDAVWRGPNPLETLRRVWDGGRMDALLLCVPPERASGHLGRGDFVFDPDGRIAYGSGPIYTGAQIIAPQPLPQVPDTAFSMRVYWDALIARGTAYGLIYDGEWCDVGHPDALPLAEAIL